MGGLCQCVVSERTPALPWSSVEQQGGKSREGILRACWADLVSHQAKIRRSRPHCSEISVLFIRRIVQIWYKRIGDAEGASSVV